MTSSDPVEQYEKTISQLKLENEKLKLEIKYLKKYMHLDFDQFNKYNYSNNIKANIIKIPKIKATN